MRGLHMIFKYDTRKINEKHYLTGIRLIRERGHADYILEDDKNFDEELVDENFKLQWEFVKNPEYLPDLLPQKINRLYILVRSVQPLTAEEERSKRDRIRRMKIKRSIGIEDVVKALIAFSEGDGSGIAELKELIK